MSTKVYDKDGNEHWIDPLSLHSHLAQGFTLKLEPVEEETESDEFDRETALELLKENGIKVHHKTGDAKIMEMLEALEGK